VDPPVKEDIMSRKGFLLTLLLAFGLAAPSGPAAAQTPGVTANEIKIGNTNPYSGPASAYGTIGKAIAAYFKKVNDEGGINGHKVNFITYDDAYSPPKAVEMVRKLVEQDQVAALFQTLGTPTNTAIHKYVNQQKIPHLFVATGATKWNDPKNFPWTMGWQPNYQTEGRVYAAYIMKNFPDAKIGILYQNDDYGKDYRKGLHDGLGDAAKKMIVLEQTYEVTDPTIDSQIVNLKNSGANVFFNVTIPKFAVQAIKKAHDIGWKPAHFLNNVSSSLATVLKPAGLDASKGLITALYMKEITDPQWKNDKGFQDWVAWMKKYYPEGALDDQSNAFGYTAAQAMTQVLKQCGTDFSRENIMKQAENLKNVEFALLLPGIKVSTSPTDHAPIEQEQLAKFDGERWVTFGDLLEAVKK
jgi:branched-chain amino acid transport system substrate-binding protein